MIVVGKTLADSYYVPDPSDHIERTVAQMSRDSDILLKVYNEVRAYNDHGQSIQNLREMLDEYYAKEEAEKKAKEKHEAELAQKAKEEEEEEEEPRHHSRGRRHH